MAKHTRTTTLAFQSLSLCALLTMSSSCINQHNTRFPTVFNYGPEYEREQAAVQDPYPDSIAGPETGFRPNEFNLERPETSRARDRWTATRMRQDYQQNNSGGQQPLFAPTSMSPYPMVAPPPATAVTPYSPYPPPYPPYPSYPAVVPVGPAAPGPYWMPYSPPVVVRPIVLPRFSVNLVLPFH